MYGERILGDVKVGDVVMFYHRPYQHRAHMRVVKVNRATFDAVEVAGSYGGPITAKEVATTHSHLYVRAGTKWRIHKTLPLWRGEA